MTGPNHLQQRAFSCPCIDSLETRRSPSNWKSYDNTVIQNQIKQDVNAVLQTFNETTGGILSSVALASLQLPLLQSWPEVPTQQFYDSIASQISSVFNDVTNIAHAGFAPNGSTGYTFTDFEGCLSSLVLQGGLSTGESCVKKCVLPRFLFSLN